MAARWCQYCSHFYSLPENAISFLLQITEDCTIPNAKWTECTAKWDVINWSSSWASCWFLCESKNNTEVKNELALEHSFTNYVCEQVKKALEINLPCTAHLHVYIGPPKIQEGNMVEI